MSKTPVQPLPAASMNRTPAAALEARLRYFFAEQARLRELLEKTRADLDRVNDELMQFERDYCTDEIHAAEYSHVVERLLGTDLTLDPSEMGKPIPDDGFIPALLQRLEAGTK